MQYYINRCERRDLGDDRCDSVDLETAFVEFEADDDDAARAKFEELFEAIDIADDQYLELAWDEECFGQTTIHIIAIADNKDGVRKWELDI